MRTGYWLLVGVSLVVLIGCLSSGGGEEELVPVDDMVAEEVDPRAKEILGDLFIEVPEIDPEENGYLLFSDAVDHYYDYLSARRYRPEEMEDRLWLGVDAALEKSTWYCHVGADDVGLMATVRLSSFYELWDRDIRAALARGDEIAVLEKLDRGLQLCHKLASASTVSTDLLSLLELRATVFEAMNDVVDADLLDQVSLRLVGDRLAYKVDLLEQWARVQRMDVSYPEARLFFQGTEEEVTEIFDVVGSLGDEGDQSGMDEDSVMQQTLLTNSPPFDRVGAFARHVDFVRLSLALSESYDVEALEREREVLAPYLAFHDLFDPKDNADLDVDEAMKVIGGRENPIGDFLIGKIATTFRRIREIFREEEAKERLAVVKVYARVFELENDRVPQSFEELSLPASLGLDPFGSGELGFDPVGKKVWSVGVDGVDGLGDEASDMVLGF